MAYALRGDAHGSTFHDRAQAGRLLGERLLPLRRDRPVVLALPRGGVPVAAEVARMLDAPLDVIVVRKLGVPFQPELGFGAIGEGDVAILDRDLIRRARISDRDVQAVIATERAELERRVERYRGGHPPVRVLGRTVVIVDDGIATGATARVAVQVARVMGARKVVVAVPVAPPETVARLRFEADEVVCLFTPPHFVAVGQWYENFEQTSDRAVSAALHEANRSFGQEPVAGEVAVRAGDVYLAGELAVPDSPSGIVLFAHGSGSSRHSPRNQTMARGLRDHGFGTLLFDLLTEAEAGDRRHVFDVTLLGERLLGATVWLRTQSGIGQLPVGYFGASTGAAAALWAAGAPGNEVGAVVSRGGRPDLAGARLAAVRCPTLLIVGGADTAVLALNREAAARLRATNQLAIVPGATHLFEEPGAMEVVSGLAADWFERHLGVVADARPGVS
jgi:predicted phosphoribosyltransferase/dienelactone hydrolase